MARLSSLRWRIAGALCLLTLIVVLPFVVVSQVLRRDTVNEALAGKAETLVALKAATAAHAVWNLDETELRLLLDGLSRDPDFHSAEIRAEFGKVFRRESNRPALGETLTSATAPLTFDNGGGPQWLGELTVTLSESRLAQRLDTQFAVALFTMLAFALLLALTLVVMLQRMVFLPLDLLVRSIATIRGGSWTPVPWRRADEFGRVIAAFNAMVENQRSSEEALREARDLAEQASRAKNSFLARMSHEMRTPLNVVIGFADLIRVDSAVRPEQRFYAQEIEQSGHRLLSMVVDVLDLAEIEAGGRPLNESEASPARMVEAALANLRPRRPNVDQVLELHLAEPLPRLFCDRVRVRRMLEHLIDNALKFNDAQGRAVLSVDVDPAGQLVFQIVNSGPGMSADKIALALMPFGQADESRTRRHEGAGLGLPLSRHYAALHGATLDIRSVPGQETVVTVAFPPERTLPTGASMGLPGAAVAAAEVD
ncbi:MAG TPA: ATP-binding protein [Alphaproteobacteria bacterium]|nr:ATP-binding protein [Alphaproteobacteria bacterium]